MRLMLASGARPRQIDFEPRALTVAGFTGRDSAAVMAHVEELADLGVPAPVEVPTFYSLPCTLLTTASLISVNSQQTSAEVEPVLFCADGELYVGVGSDHTARDLERVNIRRSKAACPKVIGMEVVSYREAVAVWDEIELRTRAGADIDLYQEGRASDLLPIPVVIEEMRQRGHELVDGTIIFLGTVPLKAKTFVYSDRWTLELSLPAGPTLACSYEVAFADQPSEVVT